MFWVYYPQLRWNIQARCATMDGKLVNYEHVFGHLDEILRWDFVIKKFSYQMRLIIHQLVFGQTGLLH